MGTVRGGGSSAVIAVDDVPGVDPEEPNSALMILSPHRCSKAEEGAMVKLTPMRRSTELIREPSPTLLLLFITAVALSYSM